MLGATRSVFLVMLLFALSVFGWPDPAQAAATLRESGDTQLYETFELTLDIPAVAGNRFTQFATVVFSRGERHFVVDGFYDGDDEWRVRFMPDEEGRWTYSWALYGDNGIGSFVCTPRRNRNKHGHVHPDEKHPRYLIHDDGTAHYWFGASWIGGNRYGPASKGGEENRKHISDGDFLEYFDTLRDHRINGLLLEIQLFPLENDQLSWDLEWIRRGEFLVREMATRDISCHLSIFGTWSRGKNGWFEPNTRASRQVLNSWAEQDEVLMENYLRTIVARFAGYANVYWELGNEMGHSPNSGEDFVRLANEKYIPWLRKYDPYGLPIGLSEDDVWAANIDVEFSHQSDQLPQAQGQRPRIMNELVRGGIDGMKMWKDETIRNPRARLGYRRTFWRMFTYGGCGSSAATLVRFGQNNPLDGPVLDVIGDQGRLRDFLDTLPTHINEMDTDPRFVTMGPGAYRTRAQTGQSYVVYYLLPGREKSVVAGNTSVLLPMGEYTAVWYNPREGTFGDEIAVQGSRGSARIAHPAFHEDIVLRITRSRK